MNQIPGGERHNQEPDEHYADLVDDFTRTLDLDAGLADATQPGHYSAMANDLSHLLDLDTGLATILNPAEPHTSPSSPGTPAVASNIPGNDSYALRLASLLPSLEPQTRFRLRTDPQYMQLLDAVQLALDLARPRVRGRARARALDIARDLDIARARALVQIRAFAFARNLGLNLNFDMTNLVSPRQKDLSLLLMVLENSVVDFTHADLSAASLVGVPLEGIWWSSATLWPPEWEERIRAESIETDDGIFVIRGEGQQNADLTM